MIDSLYDVLLSFSCSVWEFLCQNLHAFKLFLFDPKHPYEWVGFLATTFSALCYIPQIRRIRRTQSSKDISFWMFAIWILGSTVWLIYGIRLMKWPVIWTNGINLVFRIWVLSYKHIVDRRYKKNTIDPTPPV